MRKAATIKNTNLRQPKMRKHFVLRRSWLCAALLASFAAPALAAFQTGSSSALPATTSPGNTVTLAASIQSSVAASNMVVDLEVHNSAGAKVGQSFYQGQNFSAGQAIKYSWNFVAPAVAGQYTLEIGVFTAGFATDLYWGNSAGFTVTQAAAPINGKCGSSGGAMLSSAPTTNLCSAGTASAVSGTGPWTWNCSAQNSGVAASCSASVATSNSAAINLQPPRREPCPALPCSGRQRM